MKSAIVLLGIAALAIGAEPARAHAILVESAPAINATLPAGAATLRLRYNSRIDAVRSRLTLIDAKGGAQVLPVSQGGPPDQLQAAANLQPGAWRLRWQVLAVDGHITRGDLPFTVVPPQATPVPKP